MVEVYTYTIPILVSYTIPPLIRYVEISGNTSAFGGGVTCEGFVNYKFENSIIAFNNANSLNNTVGGFGHNFEFIAADATLENSIVWNEMISLI